jgi:large subunit ribosomal protein L35Ae
MEGLIANFRGSHHTQYENQMIIHAKGVDSKDKAAKLVGKKVVWTSSAGKEIKGEIKAAHGNNGAVRAIFEKGMPGQSLGEKVKIE